MKVRERDYLMTKEGKLVEYRNVGCMEVNHSPVIRRSHR